MPAGSYQEQRWRQARKESLRRLRRFEDLEQRTQHSREQQVLSALEQRRELRRKQDECMRKPWKRPSTPKKDILKRGDGARRRRAALQRSIEKAADELGHRAPCAWHKPAAEPSRGVRQFIQQQRALQRGFAIPPEEPPVQPQQHIPWQDVKLAAGQRFQALLGVGCHQQGISSRQFGPGGNHSSAGGLEEGGAADSWCRSSMMDQHSEHFIPLSSAHVDPVDRQGHELAQNSSPISLGPRPSRRDQADDTAVQQSTSNWQQPQSSMVQESGTCMRDSGACDPGPRQLGLGLAFSDLVRQSIEPGQLLSCAKSPSEERMKQGTCSGTGAAQQSGKQGFETQRTVLEAQSCHVGAPNPVVNVPVTTWDHDKAGESAPGVQGAGNNRTSVTGASCAPESRAQPQRTGCASSFTGILGEPCSTPVEQTGNTLDTAKAAPSHGNQQPHDHQNSLKEDAQDTVPEAQDMHPAHLNENNQQQPPTLVPQSMQQLQIMRQSAHQQLESTFHEFARTAHADHQVEPHKQAPSESCVEVQQGPEVQVPDTSAGRLCEENRRLQHVDQILGTASTPVQSVVFEQDSRSAKHGEEVSLNSTKEKLKDDYTRFAHRQRIQSGGGHIDRIVVHGLECSRHGAFMLNREVPARFKFQQQRCMPGSGGCPQLNIAYGSSHQVEHPGDSYGVSNEELGYSQNACISDSSHRACTVQSLHERMSACQGSAQDSATPITAAQIQHETLLETHSQDTHEMTLHGWVSATGGATDISQSGLLEVPRRRYMRGDSAQSWMSRPEHRTPRQASTRIPEPPRSTPRPCADLTPLQTPMHSKLPSLRRRKQETAEELCLFEREFKDLDSDPEVLAMITKKSVLSKTTEPRPVRGFNACEQNTAFAAQHRQAKGENGYANAHPPNTSRTPSHATEQGKYDTKRWHADGVQGPSDSMEMHRLEDSIEALNGRLRSSRRLKNHLEPLGRSRTVDTQRLGGQTSDTGGQQRHGLPTTRQSRPTKRLQRIPQVQCAKIPSRESNARWARGSQIASGFGKHQAYDALIAMNGGNVEFPYAHTPDRAVAQWDPAPSLPSPQEAHELWTHIITAGMIATFGSAEAGSTRWGAVAPAHNNNGLGRKMGL